MINHSQYYSSPLIPCGKTVSNTFWTLRLSYKGVISASINIVQLRRSHFDVALESRVIQEAEINPVGAEVVFDDRD